MSSHKAIFDKKRLVLARQLAGIRKNELAAKAGVSASAITTWESGARTPTTENLEALATVLSLPLSFFEVNVEYQRPGAHGIETINGLVASSSPHFRSLRSTTQLQRDQAAAYTYLVHDVAGALSQHIEFPERQIPDIPADPDVKNSSTPEFAAQQVRAEWGLGRGPITHVIRELEKHGVAVVFAPPQSDSIDAYSVDTGFLPIVVLHPVKSDYYRQRFDAAHELGHLVMHADAEPGNKTIEAQAHEFAAEFLMPAESIRRELPTRMDGSSWMKLKELKEYWGVSMQALLYRAKTLGCLSEASYRNAMITISKNKWRTKEPGAISTLEQPSLFPRALEIVTEAGIIPEILRESSQVPQEYFEVITSRVPYSQKIL